LGCGLVYEIPEYSRVNFIIRKSADILNILIPKLNQYPLQGVKNLNFEDFKLSPPPPRSRQLQRGGGGPGVMELIKNKEKLTTFEGLNKIIKIKSGMNTGRIFNLDKEDSNVSGISDKCVTTTKSNTSLKSGNIIQKREFHTSVRASLRIGPHNQDILSVIIGSLLGSSSHANARTIEGTRISYRQGDIHIDYLF